MSVDSPVIKNLRILAQTANKSRRVIALILFGSLLLSLLALVSVNSQVQATILKETQEQISKAGFHRVSISIDGRSVTLDGEVSSTTAKAILLHTVSHIEGVHGIRTNLAIVPLRLPHLRIQRTEDQRLLITGELTTEDEVKHATDVLEKLIDHNDAITNITVTPEVPPAKWITILGKVAITGNQLTSLSIEIGAGKLQIGGLVDLKSRYDNLIEEIYPMLDDTNLNLVNKIGVLHRDRY